MSHAPGKGPSATTLIHHPYEAPGGFDAVVPGVHKGSTVLFRNVADLHSRQWMDKSGYTYGLHGTPTSFTLEERLATLEGGLQCLLTPSGLSAISLVDMALLQSGDEVLLPDNAYGPGKDFARVELARWGVTTRCYDSQDAASLAALITPATRLVWLEAAGSVTLEFPDLLGLLRVCRQHPQLVVALDNTWGAGLAFNAFALDPGEGLPQGVDVSIHALTKYPSGGADVLMGSVTTRSPELHKRLKLCHMRLGLGVGMDDVAAVLRGLPSMPLRYAAQDRSAREIAQWALAQPQVAQVLHPALAGSPGHSHWAGLCTQAAGLLSLQFDLRYSAEQVHAFVDALQLFGIGYSWGGPMSLAVPYDLRSMRQHPAPSLHAGTLVRLCIGLEDTADLIADLQQALNHCLPA
ncbi:cystathionine beta-lyase [Aquabacterium lacunae]|uniref:Cystathionine beta-lyase n=1 Tax=Aquabacterium lacunae TaxID=2528630 RepID=A0A4Q9H3J3_9BURK|nr:PLP-dependent transferase [Aquabacterium lacunae]TBO32425.1 cystathionine beta-lyase [Aquabacterium lacunae]